VVIDQLPQLARDVCNGRCHECMKAEADVIGGYEGIENCLNGRPEVKKAVGRTWMTNWVDVVSVQNNAPRSRCSIHEVDLDLRCWRLSTARGSHQSIVNVRQG
jgi:hypothetical protein